MELMNTTKQKQTYRYRAHTSGYQWRVGIGEGQDRRRGLKGTNYVLNKLQIYCIAQGI